MTAKELVAMVGCVSAESACRVITSAEIARLYRDYGQLSRFDTHWTVDSIAIVSKGDHPINSILPPRAISVREAARRGSLPIRSFLPQVLDIDAAYDDIDLTDEEVAGLNTQRESRSARPTVPLVRFSRP